MSVGVKVARISGTVVELSIDHLAQAFASLDDDSQAQFFCKVAELAKSWDSATMQWWYIGKHLRDCECSTDEGREMLREIVDAMNREPVESPAK